MGMPYGPGTLFQFIGLIGTHMNRNFDSTDLGSSDDFAAGKTKEEHACGRVLLAIAGAGLVVFGLYTLATVCGIIMRAG